jgi:hypothetical protein
MAFGGAVRDWIVFAWAWLFLFATTMAPMLKWVML